MYVSQGPSGYVRTLISLFFFLNEMSVDWLFLFWRFNMAELLYCG